MSKYVKVLKYMLFCFNLLFWAVGCAIIAIGIYFVVHNIYGTLFPNSPSLTSGNVLIFFGCIIMVFGFLGCMGALKENKCLLLTFFILLLLILLSEVILAIILFIYEKEIDPYVTEQLTNSFNEQRGQNQNNQSSTTWHDIQGNGVLIFFDAELKEGSKLKCCGINSSKDWEDSIPQSCCPVNTKVCTETTAFQVGCVEVFRKWFENNFLYVGIAIICASIIEVLGMSFALTFYCHISRSSGSLST